MRSSAAKMLVCVILAAAGTKVAIPSIALADAGACGTTAASNGCTSNGTGGAGYSFRWQVSDGNMTDNEYSNGSSTNDTTTSIKKGTTTYVRFCTWSAANQGGTMRGYTTSTSSWSTTTVSDVSSVYLRTSNTC
jgi:hypothetical protein